MDFVRSHFGKMQLWQVEHFFLHKKVPVVTFYKIHNLEQYFLLLISFYALFFLNVPILSYKILSLITCYFCTIATNPKVVQLEYLQVAAGGKKNNIFGLLWQLTYQLMTSCWHRNTINHTWRDKGQSNLDLYILHISLNHENM